MSAAELVLADIRLPERGPACLVLGGGRILDVLDTAPEGAGCPVLEANGALVLAPLIDGHVHLDKTRLGLPFTPHIPGTDIAARIAAEEAQRAAGGWDMRATGAALVERAAGLGTFAMRSHADITPGLGLAGLEAELALKASHAGIMDISIVAFPQSGLIGRPGVLELMEEALAAGADMVGGLDPAGRDEEIERHLDAVFRLAERHDAGVDIHLHDRGTLGAFELRRIAARALRHGRAGRVTVSHAYCLGELAPDEFARTAGALAEAGVSILTNVPLHVPMPPVPALEAAGVQVFLGSDNVRDAWSPFGDADMIARAALLCRRQNWRADPDLAHAYALASSGPAPLFNRRAGPPGKGMPADFLLVAAQSVAEAVATGAPERTVIRAGRVIARDGALLPAAIQQDPRTP